MITYKKLDDHGPWSLLLSSRQTSAGYTLLSQKMKLKLIENFPKFREARPSTPKRNALTRAIL